MVKPIPSRGVIRPLGPSRFWVVNELPSGAMRVEPAWFRAAAYLAVGMICAIVLFAWLIPGESLTFRLFFSIIAIIAGAVIFSVLIWIDDHEQKQGAYLIIDAEGCHFSGNNRIPLEEFEISEIVDKWEPVGKVSSLILKAKSGRRYEVLSSMNRRDIGILKKSVDIKVNKLLRCMDMQQSPGPI